VNVFKEILELMKYFYYIFLLFSLSVSAQTERFKVVLDAGHGGKDPGKVHKKILEKEIALNITLLVGKELEKDPLFKVTYTRKDDRFIELYERGAIANKAKADLFISIHCNSSPSKDAHGSESYVLGLHANDLNFEVAKGENQVIYLEKDYKERYAGYDINSPESFIGLSIMQEEFLEQSIQAAKRIQSSLAENPVHRDRGVKQAGFIVLHQTYMPSVLIETGFLSNAEERDYLYSAQGQKQVAEAIAKAIKNYRYWLKNRNQLSPENAANDLIYRVQIATSNKDLAATPSNFKGLSPILKEKVGNAFRYYYGKETDLKKIDELLQIAKKKGFTDAFIVSFSANGKRNVQ
jgi:N-acetylmuramoyl-L-alanine amidase, family 3